AKKGRGRSACRSPRSKRRARAPRRRSPRSCTKDASSTWSSSASCSTAAAEHAVVDDPVIAALVEGFAAEARDICQRITANILDLEHADVLEEVARKKHYEELARGLHTLKGNADTFGFSPLAELAH